MRAKNKLSILLTGATGVMGGATLDQLTKACNRFKLKVLARHTKFDQEFLAKFQDKADIEIVWGDLVNYSDVKTAVNETDIILHLGALVSPAADKKPQLAWQINVGGTKNILQAIQDLGQNEHTKLVYVGSVGQYGNRPNPIHWGRVGDPLLPSAFDYYSISKTMAERAVLESGLKYWVSLRQTGIIHKNIFAVDDGISYHQPLNNCLEWVSAKDSARLLYNLCSKNLPENFWRQVYNIGGGESNRLTAYEFLQKFYQMLGVDFQKLEEPNWYASRNFHGMWYLDSDKLEKILHFRSQSVDDVLREIKQNLPLQLKLLRFLPSRLVKSFFTTARAKRPNTPLYWFKHQEQDKIVAFFGSEKEWRRIPSWKDFALQHDNNHLRLNHGYDETKADEVISLDDLRTAAKWRGGQCLAQNFKSGNIYQTLDWICSEEHHFKASPFSVLKAGHWCDRCLQAPWNNDQLARRSQFIAQVWRHDHQPDENQVYGTKLDV